MTEMNIFSDLSVYLLVSVDTNSLLENSTKLHILVFTRQLAIFSIITVNDVNTYSLVLYVNISERLTVLDFV